MTDYRDRLPHRKQREDELNICLSVKLSTEKLPALETSTRMQHPGLSICRLEHSIRPTHA